MELDEINQALDALAAELAQRGVRGKIYLVGGAAMILAFQSRTATGDVDAGVYPPEEVLAAAAEVGRRLGLPEDWLSDQAKIYFPSVGSIRWNPVLHWDSLEVVAADERTMLALKLRASRGRRDETDIRFLLQRLGIDHKVAALPIYEEFFPEDPLPERADRILNGIYGEP